MNEKLNEAISFAAQAHKEQVRKMTGTPYILHPMEVASIICTITNDENVIIAGLLHDTVEDCGVLPETIKSLFGSRVSALVQSESEDKLSDRPPADTWMERKADSLLMLENIKDTDVKILWLADKLSNIRSFYRGVKENGDVIWQSFNQKDPLKHAWYYERIAECVSELSDTAAYEEYVMLVDRIFSRYK